MESLANPEIWIALATLTALELVLGIDNIIFISILAGKLPPEQRDKARKLGIALAAVYATGPAVRHRLDHRADRAAVRAVRPRRSRGAT